MRSSGKARKAKKNPQPRSQGSSSIMGETAERKESAPASCTARNPLASLTKTPYAYKAHSAHNVRGIHNEQNHPHPRAG